MLAPLAAFDSSDQSGPAVFAYHCLLSTLYTDLDPTVFFFQSFAIPFPDDHDSYSCIILFTLTFYLFHTVWQPGMSDLYMKCTMLNMGESFHESVCAIHDS